MIISIHKKNKEVEVETKNNLNNIKSFNLGIETDNTYTNQFFMEDMFNLQLMESCISIDEDYDLWECNDNTSIESCITMECK